MNWVTFDCKFLKDRNKVLGRFPSKILSEKKMDSVTGKREQVREYGDRRRKTFNSQGSKCSNIATIIFKKKKKKKKNKKV